MRKIPLFLILAMAPFWVMAGTGDQALSLEQCVRHSLDNNTTLQKDRLAVEAAAQSRREIVGALLPQLNASGGYTYNIQKTTFAMPNFINSMMPEAMRDPNAAKYMTVTMGMDQSANWGVALTQQLINFSLFNAVGIAKAAEEMAQLGVEADSKDVIAKTATLYYNAQILQYSLGLFDESLAVMERTSGIMEANRDNGLVKKVDADRIAVTKINLETEKSSLLQAFEVQKNLLKLEMGFPMTDDIEIEPLDMEALENQLLAETAEGFELEAQLPYQMLKQQQEMLDIQRKSAISEVLPVFTLNANYSENFMGDHFHGETYNRFPVSMVSVNMRMPLFSGMSKNAKVRKAGIELEKSLSDEEMLQQALTMGYENARMQLEQSRNSLESQKRNRQLAQDVLKVTESNYQEGIAPLSDLLNASSSLIQAEMNYVSTLNNFVKAFIELKKADGSIADISGNILEAV